MKKTFFLVNHYMVYGAGQALRDYCKTKKIEFRITYKKELGN